jgi:TPR repeat protein
MSRSKTNDNYRSHSVHPENAGGQSNDGFCLEYGQGLEKDSKLIAHACRLSADQGHAVGQYKYGLCLDQGRGVEKDLKWAAYYFKFRADQGDAGGQFNYGFC